MSDEYEAEPVEEQGGPKAASKGWLALPFFVAIILIAIPFPIIWMMNGEFFTYAIDDTYIHLALSENIAQLHYGINAKEASAPASSILWPILLAPFAYIEYHVYAPFALNVLFSLASVGIILALFGRMKLLATPRGPIYAAGLASIAVIGLNFVSNVYVGMEHPLQIFLTLTILLGLARFVDEGRIAWWLVLAVVLAPLVRYESLAISAAAILVMLLRRRFLWPLISVAAIALVIGLFSLMLHSFGLSMMPSSILIHHDIVRESMGEGAVQQPAILERLRDQALSMAVNAKDILYTAEGRVVGVIGAILLVQLFANLRRPLSLIRLFAVLSIAAYLLAGKFGGSFFRYETMIVVLAIAALVYTNGELMKGVSRHVAPGRGLAVALVLVLVLFSRYAYESVQIPQGANNIYDQQYQMHRFITDYWEDSVGVHDLGYTAYQNPSYVLDFFGLASQDARRMRLAQEEGWMQKLADQHNVGLAILYQSRFEESLPEEWETVATMSYDDPNVSNLSDTVHYYLIDPARRDEAIEKLEDFQTTLPDGVHLTIAPGPELEPAPGPEPEPVPEIEPEPDVPMEAPETAEPAPPVEAPMEEPETRSAEPEEMDAPPAEAPETAEPAPAQPGDASPSADVQADAEVEGVDVVVEDRPEEMQEPAAQKPQPEPDHSERDLPGSEDVIVKIDVSQDEPQESATSGGPTP